MMTAKVKSILGSITLAGILIVSFQNCGPGWVNSVTTGGTFASKADIVPGSPGFEQFQSGFYAWANQKGCTTCHAGVIKPYFVSPDPSIAYNEAKSGGIVDFGNPSGSVVIAHSGNGHCNVAVCTSTTNPGEVSPLVAAWARAENGATGGTPTTLPSSALPKYMTATVPMPANIPTTMVANPAILRFQLGALGIAGLPANSVLEIEIQMVTPDVYRIRSPKIGNNTAAVTVTGLHIYVKGPNEAGVGSEDAQGAFWSTLSAQAATFAIPANQGANTRIGATPLTTQAIAVPKKAVAPAVDMITIGIENIQ